MLQSNLPLASTLTHMVEDTSDDLNDLLDALEH